MAKKEDTELKDLEEKLVNAEDQLKRAVADYRNLEKRVHDDAVNVMIMTKISVITRILPVLDSLDQAVAGAAQSEAESAWLKGVLMSIKQFRQVLADEGLLEIPTDEQFDPNLHEAIDVAEGEEGKILKVALRGYTLNGTIVRPARVVVGKSNPDKISTEAIKEIEEEN
ncbi:nucleotide exchange factor GrpE [Patescibacteria group bacterium]|nr:nucleotide exchange factor GrpE [Patescibacteria group bacterium]MCL5410052.1 nucleotide exchange factor GrpE [Patescibacteria group bacterium]